MNRPTSKQYLAKAFEYGDWAKTSVGSARRHEFRELEARFSVLAVLADNDELLREENAVCRIPGRHKSNDPCIRGSGSAMSWGCAYYAMEYTAG
jgi:hypothetical protein